MQPYIFPYPGYFSLIANTEYWLLFDLPQYTPQSWITRNRLLNLRGGWEYFSIPLASASERQRVWEVQPRDLERSKEHLLGRLSQYRRSAPYARDVVDLVKATFASAEAQGGSIVALNHASLEQTCSYLEVPFKADRLSALEIDLSQVNGPGMWSPIVTEAVGGTAYLNPINGRHLFDVAEFDARSIELLVLEWTPIRYESGPFPFVENLSILDVLLWNDPETVKRQLTSNATISRVLNQPAAQSASELTSSRHA